MSQQANTPSNAAMPPVPAARGRLAGLVGWCRGAAVRVSLLISPWPAALLMRRVFAAGGARLATALDRHAPANVIGLINERYGADPDMLLDVFRPASASGPLPLVVWVHGGGFVGGTKDELAGYFKLVASNGFAVAAPRYSLAPGRRYPTPPRQLMQALQYLQANAGRLLIDPDRIALAGDSAGAHIAAQAGALVTTPGYAEAVGITPTITPAQLRGLILACGPYDLQLVRHPTAPAAACSCRSLCRHTRASGASSTTPRSQHGRSPTTSAPHSRPRSSLSATPTRCGPTLSSSLAGSRPRGPKPRRSSSPPGTSRQRITSTSSTSTPTQGNSSSTDCSPSCGSGSRRHHPHQTPTLPPGPAQRHNGGYLKSISDEPWSSGVFRLRHITDVRLWAWLRTQKRSDKGIDAGHVGDICRPGGDAR